MKTRNYATPAVKGLTRVRLNCLLLFFSHLKLELLTQLQKYFYL